MTVRFDVTHAVEELHERDEPESGVRPVAEGGGLAGVAAQRVVLPVGRPSLGIANDVSTEVEGATTGASDAPRAVPIARPDRAVLIRLQGPLVGQACSVPEAGLRLGCGPDSDLQVEEASVSRFHASIQCEAGAGFVLYDLGSHEGTTVDDIGVTRWVLQEGDVIRLGPSSAFLFSWVDAKEEKELFRRGRRRD